MPNEREKHGQKQNHIIAPRNVRGQTFNQIIWKRGVSGAASAIATLQFMFTLVGEMGEYEADNYA